MHSQTIQTGISDFHKMTLTQMKLRYNKLPPKTIIYKDYKSFNKDAFEEELNFALQAANTQPAHATFLSIFSCTLDKHAPVKKRKVRGNQEPFMNKALRKAIIRRSNLLNKFVNNITTKNWESYRKQRNKCVKIRSNARREYFKKLDAPHLSNSYFWTTLKPFFFEKSGSRKKPIIIENDVILSDNAAVAEVFSKHFANITDTLNLPEYIPPRDHNPDISDPVLRAIEISKVHPSIRNIKELTNKLRDKPFEFNHVLSWEIC